MLPASAGMIPDLMFGEMTDRVLPASAGMIPRIPRPLPGRTRAPRIRGDDPDDPDGELTAEQCSPHPRG